MKLAHFLLLELKKFNGCSQEKLLSSLSNKYSSIASARAALSRALRMLNALGLIEKKNKIFFITKKGEQEIQNELKVKLIIMLNELINQPNAVKSIEKIIANLSILIEKSKHDKNFCLAALNQTNFFISDLKKISKDFKKNIIHQKYLFKILQKQIKMLEEMNFTDIIELPLTKENLKKIFDLIDDNQLFFSTNNSFLYREIQKKLKIKAKEGNFIIEKEKQDKLLKILIKKNAKFEFRAGNIQVKHVAKHLFIKGNFKKLKLLQKMQL